MGAQAQPQRTTNHARYYVARIQLGADIVAFHFAGPSQFFSILSPFEFVVLRRFGRGYIFTMASSSQVCYTQQEDGVTVCTMMPIGTSTADADRSKPGEAGSSTTTGTQPERRPGQTSTGAAVKPSATPLPTVTTAPSTSTPRPSRSQGTASETSAPLPAVSSDGGSQGVSKGAVAGIAISTAIIGAAIALFAAFFFLKRRRRTSGHPYSDFAPEFVSHVNVKNTPYVQISQSSAPPPPVLAAASHSEKRDLDLANLSNSSDFLAGVLAPAADEQSVQNKVAALFKRFQDHVDSYYRDVHATMTPSMESDLARFGDDLIEIVENSSVPTVAIKHALAGYILNIVSPEAEDQATLFPAEIAGLKASERSADAGRCARTCSQFDVLKRLQKTKPHIYCTNV